MKISVVILYILVIASLSITLFSLLNKKSRTAFVETAYVFNEFKLKKEMEAKFIEIEKTRKSILDSLFEKIKQAETLKLNSDQLDILKRDFLYKKQKFEEESQTTKNSYDSQIWNQLNQYVKEYGEENGFEIIFGANGQGNIMHADESLNISKEIIEYANRKYSGK